jgi:hypothetical protein
MKLQMYLETSVEGSSPPRRVFAYGKSDLPPPPNKGLWVQDHCFDEGSEFVTERQRSMIVGEVRAQGFSMPIPRP